MVVSKLSKNINYIEKMRLDSEDVDHNATSYNVTIKDYELLIAIGKEKYSFVNKNVIYFPIYLIKDNKVFNQIGVYEIYSHKLPNILDEDGDVDLDELGEPLLYSFVDNAYLRKFTSVYDSDSDDESSDGDEGSDIDDSEDENNEDDNSEDDKDIKDDSLTKKTKFIINEKEMDAERDSDEEKYDSDVDGDVNGDVDGDADRDVDKDDEISDDGLWIQKYLKDQKYDIVDTVTNGDCFFDAIRLALEQRTGESTTVKKLRKIVSDNITDEIFEQYKINYTMIFQSIKENESQMKKINSKNRKLKKQIQTEKSRTKQVETINEGKNLSQEFKEYKKQNELSKELLKDFYFMKDIENTQQLKDFVLKNEFYADTIAISILEKQLNIKFIILSLENYIHADLNNVVLCGQLNDEVSKPYSPKFYIILHFEGLHYKLITHNSKTTFTFNEIPKKLKDKVYDKCCENSRGPFGLIEEFQTLKMKDTADEVDDVDKKIDSIELNTNLFDEDTVFQYYNKSSNKPLPGKGPGEKIPLNKVKDYSNLKGILNWRKQLSDEYEKEFELDEKKWLTIDHFVNANKFKNEKDLYDNLSLNSGSDESRDIFKMKDMVKKLTKDKDYDKRHDDLMKRAIKAKFTQNEDLSEMLKETKNAKLVNYKVKKQPVTNFELMKYRKTLLNKIM